MLRADLSRVTLLVKDSRAGIRWATMLIQHKVKGPCFESAILTNEWKGHAWLVSLPGSLELLLCGISHTDPSSPTISISLVKLFWIPQQRKGFQDAGTLLQPLSTSGVCTFAPPSACPARDPWLAPIRSGVWKRLLVLFWMCEPLMNFNCKANGSHVSFVLLPESAWAHFSNSSPLHVPLSTTVRTYYVPSRFWVLCSGIWGQSHSEEEQRRRLPWRTQARLLEMSLVCLSGLF